MENDIIEVILQNKLPKTKAHASLPMVGAGKRISYAILEQPEKNFTVYIELFREVFVDSDPKSSELGYDMADITDRMGVNLSFVWGENFSVGQIFTPDQFITEYVKNPKIEKLVRTYFFLLENKEMFNFEEYFDKVNDVWFSRDIDTKPELLRIPRYIM